MGNSESQKERRIMLMPARPICFLVILAFLLVDSKQCNAQADDVLEVADCRVSLLSRTLLAGERLGILEEILVREGDRVESGQLIARMRDANARAALAIADREARNDIDLRYAKKASELSTLEYSKALTLTREIPGSHSEIDILKLKLAAERAVLQVEQATQHLEMAHLRREEARIALAAYQILAPFDGTVLQVQKQVGEAIHAGESVVVLANFDRMRIEGFVPATTSWSIQPGTPVLVTLEGLGPDASFQVRGNIAFIDPAINEISQQVRIWAEVDNVDHRLKDGMKAKMHLQLSKNSP